MRTYPKPYRFIHNGIAGRVGGLASRPYRDFRRGACPRPLRVTNSSIPSVFGNFIVSLRIPVLLSPCMSTFQLWFQAARPKTLPASIIPVVLASALAAADGVLVIDRAGVALVCAMLIQIATNFINEVYDFRRGADTAERLGPTRAVASGLIGERAMVVASAIVITVTFFIGLYLVAATGWEILLVGIASLFFAWAYTGGPFPLAYRGLGDIFVFVFFGLVAVCGTYYVQALAVTPQAVLLSLVPGALSANILGVNNIRDIRTDALAGKRTLAVRIGRAPAVFLYRLLTGSAYIVPMLFVGVFGYSLWVLLPLGTFPLALKLSRNLAVKNGAELNAVLAGTAGLLVAFGVLLSVGLFLS